MEVVNPLVHFRTRRRGGAIHFHVIGETRLAPDEQITSSVPTEFSLSPVVFSALLGRNSQKLVDRLCMALSSASKAVPAPFRHDNLLSNYNEVAISLLKWTSPCRGKPPARLRLHGVDAGSFGVSSMEYKKTT